MKITTDLFFGDSKEELKKLSDNSVDLIVTSPPYADQRKSTYGGIRADKYVEWFLPISEQLFILLATNKVVPEPINGSGTVSFYFVKSFINHSGNS